MIGIDIVEVARIKRVRQLYGDRFLQKVFTGREIVYAVGKRRWAETLQAGSRPKRRL